MISWLQQVFTSRDFWINVSVAVIFVLFGKALAVLWRLIRHIRQSHQSYTVSGYWIGTCVLPSYGGKPHVEIWRIAQNREDIHLSFFCYPPDGTAISLCRGTGVFRGAILSAIYYTPASDTYESGVLAVRLKGRRLVGSYSQFDPNHPEESFFFSDTSYSLARIRLPFRQAVRMLFGFRPLLTYAAAKTLHDSVQPPKPATA